MIASGSHIRSLLLAGATLLFFSSGSSAVASIALPDLPRFELSASPAPTTGSAGASDAANQPGDHSPNEKTPSVAEFALLLGGPATSTGTSSGVSVSLPAGILHCSGTSVGLCDPAVTGWVSGEYCLFLPTPPGNDLLRPPQFESV